MIKQLRVRIGKRIWIWTLCRDVAAARNLLVPNAGICAGRWAIKPGSLARNHASLPGPALPKRKGFFSPREKHVVGNLTQFCFGTARPRLITSKAFRNARYLFFKTQESRFGIHGRVLRMGDCL